MHPSVQPKRILSISVIITFVLILTMLYQSSKIFMMDDAEALGRETEGDTKVTILTSDQIVDQSWGSLAYMGQMKIEDHFHVDTTLYSELTSDEKIEEAVKQALEAGSDLMIGHGREFSDVFTSLAYENPESSFVTIHGTSKHPNQAVYTFDKGKIDYFVALAATLKTETNKIGIIDAENDRDYYTYFEEGLSHYLPESQFFYNAVGSRDDSETAVAIMDDFLAKGVDVIYTKGNAFNQEIIEHAQKNNTYIIGYLDDQSYMARDLVLTSVLNDVAQAYMVIMEDFFSEDGIESGLNVLDESHGVYKLAPFGPMYSEQDLNYIEEQFEKFYSVEITF